MVAFPRRVARCLHVRGANVVFSEAPIQLRLGANWGAGVGGRADCFLAAGRFTSQTEVKFD